MDFFNVLRSGCSFGNAPRSKTIGFKEKGDVDVNGSKEHTSLDFFGSGGEASGSTALARPAKRKAPERSAQAADDVDDESKVAKSKQKKTKNSVVQSTAVLDGTLPKSGNAHREWIASLRRKHRIHVTGNVPDPVSSFDEMPSVGVPEWLVSNLRRLGFDAPTPIQMQCFPALLGGHHILASAPTGSGKTIAFLGPLLAKLHKPGKTFARVLVVDPTRELANQTLREFTKLTAGRKWAGRILDKLSGDKAQNIKKLDVAVATPMRLAQLLRDGRADCSETRHLVLDEADKLLDLGFAPQIDEILSFLPKADRELQTMLFSATLPPAVIELASSILTMPLRISIGEHNAAAPDVEQKLMFITNEDGKLSTLRQLVKEGQLRPPTLVFVQSKERAQELFSELVYEGIFVDVIHAERTRQQRDNVVKGFRAGKIWVLICTDLMARGVDFKGVEVVVNYDFPQSAATYIHRVGRTGRAGRKGKAITFFTISDFPALRSIVSVMRQSGCDVPEWMLKMKRQNKKERRQAERRPPKRKSISTVPSYDLKKAKKKREMIEGSKRRKAKMISEGEAAS